MIRVLFICHGNICRSPMGEFIFSYLVSQSGLSAYFAISSAGVSSEEEGNDIYPPAKRVLAKHRIPFRPHHAHRIADKEFREADLVIALDRSNYLNLARRFASADKIQMLLDRDVDDPWYTGDFETAFSDIYSGCEKLLNELRQKISSL